MILSQFTSCGLSLIVLVCWLDVNDAIPFGPNLGGKVHPAVSQESRAWNLTKKFGSVTGGPEFRTGTIKLATDSSIKPFYGARSISNVNSNVNKIYLSGINGPKDKYSTFSEKKSIKNISNDKDLYSADSSEEFISSNQNFNSFDIKSSVKSIKKNGIMKIKELPEKYVKETDSNKPETRSLPEKMSTIDIAGVFQISGDTKAKKTSSIHTGEDVTLCWIETITIKEDQAFDPPKRLVIREFTISLENSATIPINYLECSKLDGEITPGDEETVSKTSLHEVIDSNTKKSRVLNFTSVNNVGPIVVHRQKTVRCAMGGVVSKDIYEWPDSTDNPKKRVEIKVGPSIRDVRIGSDDESGECGFGYSSMKPGSDQSPLSACPCNSDESCGESIECKEGKECNGSSTSSPFCLNGKCTTESLPEETESTTHPRDLDDQLLSSTEITKRTTTEKPDESSIKNPGGSDEAGKDLCPENDIDCTFGKTTVDPLIENQTDESCIGEKCFEQLFNESTNHFPNDKYTGTASQCSGENSMSNEESGIAETDGIITASSESCHEDSGSCSCSGSSCSINNSDESDILNSENKLMDRTTVTSVLDRDETILNNPGCNSASGRCSALPESFSDKVAITSTSSPGKNDSSTGAPVRNAQEETIPIDINVTSTTTDQGETELPDTVGTTEILGPNGFSSATESVRPCDTSKSQDCVTIIPQGINLSDDLSKETQRPSSTTDKTKITIATNEDAELSELVRSADGGTCGEGSDDKMCQSVGSSGKPKFKNNNATTDSSPEGIDANETILSKSEDAKSVKNSTNDSVTSAPTTIMNSETPMIETTSQLPQVTKNLSRMDDEDSSGVDSVTECSKDSEGGSGNCIQASTASSPGASKEQMNRHAQSPKETTQMTPESCGSAENCEPKSPTSLTPVTNLVNSTGESKKSGELSCDGSNESCEASLSGASSEICGDGSSSGDCMSNTSASEACDLSSNSCSSETNSSTGLTDGPITATTESTAKELEHFSTTVDNVSTTVETRRSTAPTLSLISAPTKRLHKLALRIKVLLEHINENKEKETLVEVEKHLLLNERPEEHGNHSLVWQLKSLNNSINMKTIKSIFNCTALENFTEELGGMMEYKGKSGQGVSLEHNMADHSVEESTTEAKDENDGEAMKKSYVSSPRTKREITLPKGKNGEEEKNIMDSSKVKVISKNLTGVNDDFKNGVGHVLCRISQELDGPVTSAVDKRAQSSTSTILKVLADPTDKRVHSQRRKRSSKVDGMVSVEELEHPINGQEIDRWSNERFFSAADGGLVRSLFEFKILTDPGEDSRRIPSGS